MAQSPSTPNTPITVDQIVAMLQELGIILAHNFGNGTAPFSLTPTSSSGGHLGPAAPTTTAPTAAGAAATAPANVAPTPVLTQVVAGSGSAGAAPISAATRAYLAGLPVSTAWSGLSGIPHPTAAAAAPSSAREVEAPAEPASPAPGAVVHACTDCGALNTVELPTPPGVLTTDSWYHVAVGRRVGVFRGWHIVKPLVTGVPEFCCKRHLSREAALAAFNEAMNSGEVHVRD